MSDPRSYAGLTRIGTFFGSIDIAIQGGDVDFDISGYPPPLFTAEWSVDLADFEGDTGDTPSASGSLGSQTVQPDWIWVKMDNGTNIGPYYASSGPSGDLIGPTISGPYFEYRPSGIFTVDGGTFGGSAQSLGVVDSFADTWAPVTDAYLQRDPGDGLTYPGDPGHTYVGALFRASELPSITLAFAGAAGAIGPGTVNFEAIAFTGSLVAGVITAGALSRGVRSRGRVVGRTITP